MRIFRSLQTIKQFILIQKTFSPLLLDLKSMRSISSSPPAPLKSSQLDTFPYLLSTIPSLPPHTALYLLFRTQFKASSSLRVLLCCWLPGDILESCESVHDTKTLTMFYLGSELSFPTPLDIWVHEFFRGSHGIRHTNWFTFASAVRTLSFGLITRQYRASTSSKNTIFLFDLSLFPTSSEKNKGLYDSGSWMITKIQLCWHTEDVPRRLHIFRSIRQSRAGRDHKLCNAPTDESAPAALTLSLGSQRSWRSLLIFHRYFTEIAQWFHCDTSDTSCLD